jgi:hypothetical protein
MTLEKNLWSWLSNTRKVFKADLHMNRVENSAISGMPDVEGFLVHHGQFWIELKSAKRPKRLDTPIRMKFQPGQAEWLIKRSKLGGNVWMLIQVGSFGDKRLYLIDGLYAKAVKDGVPESKLQDWAVLLPYALKAEMIIKRAAGIIH